MSSIFSQIIQHTDFVEKAKESIIVSAYSLNGKGYDKLDGAIDGKVIDYQISSEIKFKLSSCDELYLKVEFELTGIATIGYLNSEGDNGENEVLGLCEGQIDVKFPNDTLILENIDKIIEGIEIEATIHSAELDIEID